MNRASPPWDSPIYKIRWKKRIIKIDVTLSAQPYRADKPLGVINALAKDLQKNNVRTILDFGAGKLRNARPLRRKEFDVFPCDHSEQYEYPDSAKWLATARQEGLREPMTPRTFCETNSTFDAILVIHVMHIIPSRRHRAQVLKACAAKLRRNGLLLWVTPFHETSMMRRCTRDNECGDGHIFNRGDDRKTFYSQFSKSEIERMMEACGFQLCKQYEVEKTYAILFEKDDAEIR